ncbi:oxygen-insensitive NADPH nitroreductase [Paenibacillus sp. T3-5-0-4]|nr:oxygen-insensitive NADPH nitroreductase [Paenibacillus endoradicis]MCR8658176.1 oxygen-insensitive NADPH nitroreductase [Paenibacillus endoradicis]
MNEVIETMMQHRSIRNYKDTIITDEQLYTIIEAGQMASTSSNLQAYSIINIVDRRLRHELAELAGPQWHVDTAPVFLVWCADLRRVAVATETTIDKHIENLELTENFLVATVDTALAAQNSALAAESMGLGILFVGGIRNQIEQVSQLLKLPQHVVPLFGMCIGYPDEQPFIRPRFSLEAVLHQNSYNEEKIEATIAEYDERVVDYVMERSNGADSFSWSESMRRRLSQARQRTTQQAFFQSKGLMKK